VSNCLGLWLGRASCGERKLVWNTMWRVELYLWWID